MDFWEQTVRSFSLVDANVRYVLAGSILLGGISGGIGSFTYLQRRSLLSDTVAHSTLPGIGLAFLILGRKDQLMLLLGAALTGWLGALCVNYIISRTKIKLDAALGIVLSVFFGLGIVILTAIQKSGSGNQSGLDKFLFGQAALISKSDLYVLSLLTFFLTLLVVAYYYKLKVFTFDPIFAASIGFSAGWLNLLSSTLLVITVAIGLQIVGVVLMAAVLIIPAAAARQWTQRLSRMIMLAVFFGSISGVSGAYISFLAPHLPTGPWMVIVASFILFVSVIAAPERGALSRLRVHLKNRKKMTREHILKVLFKDNMAKKKWDIYYPFDQIMQMWSFSSKELRKGMRELKKQGLIVANQNMFKLTEDGIKEGSRIIRLHRLWEVYLTRYLELPEDHVHRDAEEMEHIITPEVEKELLLLLDKPLLDPHLQEIPYPDFKEADGES